MTVTLVFGGTFDPVHAGHVGLSRSLLQSFGDAELSLVPCKIPVHRGMPSAPAGHRYEMLMIAVRDEPGLRVDDCELRREGESYTIDTLTAYREDLGADASLVFVMGMDSWLTLPTWRDWQSFCDVAHLLVLPRSGQQWLSETEPKVLRQWAKDRRVVDIDELKHRPAGCITLAPFSEIKVSATQVRQQLAKGDGKGADIDPRVLSYISEHALYQPAGLTET